MNMNFLDFEQPIAELEAKIEELRLVGSDGEIDITSEIKRLEQKSLELTRSIFSSLTAWQIVQLARHSQRPHTIDYIGALFTEFDECHGDRHLMDDQSIIGGIARLEGIPVMVIGEEKGRTTKEKLKRNFGSPRPEGYRKALRLMELAERFNLPIITFIDTAGAYPGIDAEERNQSEAIARNLLVMSQLKVPIICTVIGEGGSGGALAIGVGDRIYMLQYSIYSVISPEGCASILWKVASKAKEAAEVMGLTAQRVHSLGLIDAIIPEPLGGAHRQPQIIFDTVKNQLLDALVGLKKISTDKLIEQRYNKFMSFGLQMESKKKKGDRV
jgi:acetyl-CoA carboxylase carboxyl transferase subunit alpha